MSYIIAFSGGCYSGKTTKINQFKSFFGDLAVTIDENIRSRDFSSIDNIRKDPSAYFALQKEIITEKILNEQKYQKNSKKIVLIDRSLADSLFYYTFYVDKNLLSQQEKEAYYSFYQFLNENAFLNFQNIYSKVLFFQPIKGTTDDPFRPKDLEYLKYIERDSILEKTLRLCPKKKIINVDLGTHMFTPIDLVMSRTITSPNDFKSYSDLMEGECLYDMSIFKTVGVIPLHSFIGFNNLNVLYSSCPFYSGENEIRDLLSDVQENINSERNCVVPNGILRKNNVMFVEHGSLYGITKEKTHSSINNTFFDFVLRKAVEVVFQKVPYFTTIKKDFEKPSTEVSRLSLDIFRRELVELQPEKIFCVDKESFDFIMMNFPSIYNKTFIVDNTNGIQNTVNSITRNL